VGCGAGVTTEKGLGRADANPIPRRRGASVADLAPYLNKVTGAATRTARARASLPTSRWRGPLHHRTDGPGGLRTTVAVNEYYFDDGRLFHYHENRRPCVRFRHSSTTATVVLLSFDSSGTFPGREDHRRREATSPTTKSSPCRHVEHLRLAPARRTCAVVARRAADCGCQGRADPDSPTPSPRHPAPPFRAACPCRRGLQRSRQCAGRAHRGRRAAARAAPADAPRSNT